MIPVIAVLGSIFGGKESTGLLLLMLIVGDIFAVYYYKHHAEWDKIKKLLPWSIIGLILGTVVGAYINDRQFKIVIAISVLLCLLLLFLLEIKKNEFKVPNNILVYSLTGILAGFSTMIGNAAGPIFSIYLLATGFKKQEFMGTSAWFFLIINLSKLLFQFLFWHNITPQMLLIDSLLIPAIAIGAVIGSILIKKINEKIFHRLALIMIAIAAVRLLI